MSESLPRTDRLGSRHVFESQDMVDLFDDEPGAAIDAATADLPDAANPTSAAAADAAAAWDADDYDDRPAPSPYMQNREISWLAFNERVLDQGADASVPLLERLNFISIFWSNLQEFFMVRVGSLTDLALLGKRMYDSKTMMTPAEQLDAIYDRCHELYPVQQRVFADVRNELAQAGVTHVMPDELSPEQAAYLDEYMHDDILPFLSPQIINARHPFPHLENGGIYILVRLDEEAEAASKAERKRKSKEEKAEKGSDKQTKKAKNVAADDAMLGLIPLPRAAERIIELPARRFSFMLLEHAIEMYAAEIFSMYTIKHTNIICVTRNADLDTSQGTDDSEDDYREHMKRALRKRGRLAPVRLECERELSPNMRKLLLKKLNLKGHQVYVTNVPLDMSYTYDIAPRLPETVTKKLVNPSFNPQWPASVDRERPIMEQVAERDILLSYPYESMDPFVQMLREAAHDPSVISIKITLYRLARQSHIAEALIAAAEEGKEVTALFELRARFDESNNIEWSQRFEEAGCNVIYGFRDYKVHSKICCITRQTDHGVEYITQLGTGNYNEKTSRLYTDFSFITADPTIGQDAVEFFRNMALENATDSYDVLWVAPLQIKPMILGNIDRQIRLAKAGEKTGLFFKTNSITDKDIIEKIAEASQAGVPTTLFVRGICCLVPGVPGYTDNVRVVSIVGRLLEHSRIYAFGPLETARIYLSSADLMTRNMEKRIEIAWPVLDDELRQRIVDYAEASLRDTAKLRELLPDGHYTPLPSSVAKPGDELIDSQEYHIRLARKRRRIAAADTVTRTAAAAASGEAAAAAKPAETAPVAEAATAFPAPAEQATVQTEAAPARETEPELSPAAEPVSAESASRGEPVPAAASAADAEQEPAAAPEAEPSLAAYTTIPRSAAQEPASADKAAQEAQAASPTSAQMPEPANQPAQPTPAPTTQPQPIEGAPLQRKPKGGVGGFLKRLVFGDKYTRV